MDRLICYKSNGLVDIIKNISRLMLSDLKYAIKKNYY